MRQQANISQPDVAKRMKVTQQTVSRWEAGLSRPRPTELGSLASLFQFDNNELNAAAGYSSPTTVLTTAQPFPIDALSWENFERFCTYLIEALYPDAKVHQAGSSGSDQDGLDIKALLADGTSTSFQCKRIKQFGPADVLQAIEAHTASATKKVIVLSRIASPKARLALELHNDWDIWDKDDVSRKIRSLSKDEQVRLVDIFFRGQREALLGETDPGAWQTAEEFFLPFSSSRSPFHHDWPLVGRETLISSIIDGLKHTEPPIKIIVGAGGAGKTRILKEVICEFSKHNKGLTAIRFASTHSEISPKILFDLGTKRKILVVDDAHDRSDLEQLFAYAAVQANNAVVILASRPYGLQSIKGQASKYGLSESQDFIIENFTIEESKQLSRQVLNSYNGAATAAERIATATLDCPLATVFSSFIFAKDGHHPELALNHPQFRNTLLDRFQKIITGSIGNGSDSRSMEKALNVLALVQPFNMEDDSVFRMLLDVEQIPTTDSKRIMRMLSESGLLFKRSGRCRLSPDMLADFIIEKQCIGDGGTSTGYCEKLFDSCNGYYLKNLLVNLSRLDWRLSALDNQPSKLLDSIWRKLKPTHKYSDPHIAAVAAAAHYQPARALAFADRLIREGLFLDQLPGLIRNAARNFEFLRHACESLWAAGKNDQRALSQNPNHAIRILKNLCEFNRFQQLCFNETVIEFAINLAEDSKSFSHAYSPFDILAGILETKIHQGFSTKDGFFFEQYDVPPNSVENLRMRAIDCAITNLHNNNPRAAAGAVEILRNSIRYPISRNFNDEWTEHFVKILLKVETSLNTTGVPAPVYLSIVDALSWHQNYGEERTSIIAKRIIAGQPTTLKSRAFKTLLHGWESFHEPQESNEQRKEQANDLSTEIINSFPDAANICKFLEEQLQELLTSKMQTYNSGVLINLIVERSSRAANAMVSFAAEHPNSELAKFVDIAITKLFRDSQGSTDELAKNCLESGSSALRQAVGLAYWRYGLLPTELTSSELEIIKSILASDEPEVVMSAFNYLRSLTLHGRSTEHAKLVIELVRCINLDLHLNLVQSTIDFIGTADIQNQLTEDDVQFFFGKLFLVEDIESYSIQRLLAHLSKQYPVETARFLMQRVEHAMLPGNNNYRPFNKGAYDRVELKFKESSEFPLIFRTTLDWLNSHDNQRFRKYGGELFNCMFDTTDKAILAELSPLINEATESEMLVLLAIISEVALSLILDEVDFIVSYLGRAEQFSKKRLDEATRTLYSSSMTGVKEGEFGKPFEVDINTASTARKVLQEMPRFAPAYKLYELLAEHAEGEIEKTTKQFQGGFDF